MYGSPVRDRPYFSAHTNMDEVWAGRKSVIDIAAELASKSHLNAVAVKHIVLAGLARSKRSIDLLGNNRRHALLGRCRLFKRAIARASS